MEALPEMKPALATGNAGVKAFSETYGPSVTTTINNARTSSMSLMRKAHIDFCKEGNKQPTVDQLRTVILRRGMDFQGKFEDNHLVPEDIAHLRKLFQWYWEELLAKVTGKGRWGQGIRCHGTISEHTCPDGTRGKYISSSDEAMVLLCLENGEQRFRCCLECETGEKKTKVDAYHPRYQTRWSSSNSGQNKYGGWSET